MIDIPKKLTRPNYIKAIKGIDEIIEAKVKQLGLMCELKRSITAQYEKQRRIQ